MPDHDSPVLAALSAWRAAIAATDRMTKALALAMELNEANGMPFTEFREVGLQYEAAQQAERLAGRHYLAARDASVASQVMCSEAGPGVADFEGDRHASS